jgi:hypothetical protein
VRPEGLGKSKKIEVIGGKVWESGAIGPVLMTLAVYRDE